MNAAPEKPTYRQLADDLQKLIESKTLRLNDRMPSLRKLARDRGVSLTTVQSAYEVLESRGLIEARPRSGFFVSPCVCNGERLPSMPQRSHQRAATVERPDFYEEVMTAINDPEIIPLGCAIPSDEVYPEKTLSRLSNAAIRQQGAKAFRYTICPGRADLRHQIALRLLRSGATVSENEVITTTGATEAVVVALSAVTRPGDLVAVEMPTFFGILRIIEALNLKVVEVPVCPIQGMNMDFLDEVTTQHDIKACIVQPNFQNPTGAVMGRADRERLATLAQEREFAIIEDDLYGDLVYEGKRPTSLLAHDKGGRVIHCGGVSKTLSPGLRVGWLVSKHYYRDLIAVKSVSFSASSTLSEMTVASFLADGGFDRHLRKIRQIYQDQSMKMRDEVFAAFPEGTRVNAPTGSFILWVQLPRQYDSERLAKDALSEGISLAPGTIFTASDSLRNCLRLNCGYASDERIPKAIRRLGELLRAQEK
ncbi:PLP-dependent aminotransferase family protein [Roseibacillus ishigakijimensis]|uniref:PLP-dependent aminotransferase family protein n=1 Tax=Roseibacillus ishigakijimensis TaxID=454146 RepID=A0A934RKU0_9BACT|nr:PLP-dependent aminotransferase family protein [Roseibacillus ishigakijimensis]MBK1833557.1 PLP-dependent aminotransferase family protein [Roseibacillus ishigakijimensis]